MQSMALSELFSTHPSFKEIADALKSERVFTGLKGIHGSLYAFAIQHAYVQRNQSFLVVGNDREEAAYLLNDLQQLMGDDACLFFPATARKAYQTDDMDNANVLMRTEILNTLLQHPEPKIVVTYPEAISEKVIKKDVFGSRILLLNKGEKPGMDFIIEVLHEYGFSHTDYVAEPGDFAIRGGIIDVYSFSSDLPLRIEFFDDEVESLRWFEPASQLSVKELQQAEIVPNTQLETRHESYCSLPEFMESVGHTPICWLSSIQNLLMTATRVIEKAELVFGKLGPSPLKRLEPSQKYCSADFWTERLKRYPVMGKWESSTAFSTVIEFRSAPQPSFSKNFELLFSHLITLNEQGFRNLLCCDSQSQMERIQAIYQEVMPALKKAAEKQHALFPDVADWNSVYTLLTLTLHEGFVEHDLKIAVYTDHQVFERYHRFKLKDRVARSRESLTAREISGLKPGDFVTHIDHGVGKFSGLEKIEVNGKMQEAIRLVYKDNDVLYVSIHSLHRIARYSGKEGEEPSLHKLGGTAWAVQKAKTKAKVKDIAKELIALYAKRKAQKGFAFSHDTYLQTELEASFIYEDTPDQQKATLDVKADMEKDYPMDRLVCGDVGFGKTEVAIRAAFKAACDGKQVAVLVPTTILALQHYKTFSERLKHFPVKVDYLNRFKTAGQQKETIEKVKQGKVDILIGTHRLVSKDIQFKDLGLMIIDEEQKFGVSTKEKLRQMKVNIDTLTLTATPIPRTLQFSLMGARDLSIIATPPPNRYPVETRVCTFDEVLIRDAIAYELERGGQVFFIHNRVQNLMEVAGTIQRLVPNAKIAIGHGQMEGEKLEEIMLGFVEGEYDVLVSTTIVESGLDIPNANTIIINDAHKFGLSDLHQMRGRVGRSNRKAFCFLITLPASVLTGDARKRLKALEEFTDLGSGFNIAMRDLDIRGAGNILGGEQSGFIADIGFEMYQKVLDEALRELKEEMPQAMADGPSEPANKDAYWASDATIDTDLELLIPDAYVNSISERIILYKQLDESRDEADLQQFQAKLTDRFGQPPPETLELFNTIRLRWLARKMGIEKIVLKSNRMVCWFLSPPQHPFYSSTDFSDLLQTIQQQAGLCKLKESNERLSLLFEGISSIHQARETLAFLHRKG